MRLMIAAGLGVLLGGLGTAAALQAARGQAPERAAPVERPFEVERSAVHAIASKTLGRTYDIYVKLPASYDLSESAQRRYPVIYLTDGPYTFQVTSGVTRVPYNQKRLEEAILVGVSYAEGTDPAVNRREDLTPWPHPKYPGTSGGAARYLQFLKTEAMPLVEERYRVDPARRVLAGQSYGGLFGAWVALNEPTLFDAYILTSPSLWYAKRELFRAEAGYARTHKELPAKIYFTVGGLERPQYGAEVDMVGDQQAFVEQLRSRNYRGLELRGDVIEGTHHETTFPVGLIHGLQRLFLRQPPRA